MRKVYYTVLFLFFTTPEIYSQDAAADHSAHNADSLNIYSLRFRFSISDSGIYYAAKALALSREINYHEGELSAILNLAISHQTLGNRANALRFALEGKKKAEEYGDESGIAKFLTVIGVEYHFAGEQKPAIENLRASDRIFEKLNLCNQHVATSWTGMSFLQLQLMDSAYYYCRKALLGSRSDSCRNSRTTIPLLHLANVFKLDRKYDSSLYYYKLHLAGELRPTKFTCEAALGIAEIYRDMGEMDSSLHYAQLSLNTGKRARLYPQIIAAYLFFESFVEQDDPAKALVYSKMSRLYRDSLEQIKYETAITNVAEFDQQQRITELENTKKDYRNKLIQFILLLGITFILLVVFILRRNNKQKEKVNRSLSTALADLKAAQSQLIQSAKMASLGELTAGIAHEIQNPLNFVSNFSEVNKELIQELKTEIQKGNTAEVNAITTDIEANEEKIIHHCKRADAIVKGMLQHSQTSSGETAPTDINTLCDEYLRLAYHGFKAKENSFTVSLETAYDESIGRIKINPQDMGRVILNIINNAFYAVNKKAEQGIPGYKPWVSVSSRKINGKAEINVADNGTGIPDAIKEKIFQPFFTTKPTGQGTGLGLSLSYDIIKAHGGEINVESSAAGTVFTIHIPLTS